MSTIIKLKVAVFLSLISLLFWVIFFVLVLLVGYMLYFSVKSSNILMPTYFMLLTLWVIFFNLSCRDSETRPREFFVLNKLDKVEMRRDLIKKVQLKLFFLKLKYTFVNDVKFLRHWKKMGKSCFLKQIWGILCNQKEV